MVKTEVTIGNPEGIHLKPASRIADAADKFDSISHLQTDYMDVSDRSIINLVRGTFRYGDKLTLVCDGPDEKEALAAMKKMLESKLED